MAALDTLKILCVSWQSIRTCYDLTHDLPGWDCLLSGVDLSCPEDAAYTILINLLTEAMELTDRFSPWYKAPAEVFGLYQPLKNLSTPCYKWELTPNALARWRPTLDMLARAIATDPELADIQATVEATDWLKDAFVSATCACKPNPPVVMIPPHILLESILFCDVCGQPLHRLEQSET
ncbi:MAG: hypothetical protein JXB47_12470 [Anaerolineae bacterium]|nr:hypothetical protein [Anaerolineae bacterium]